MNLKKQSLVFLMLVCCSQAPALADCVIGAKEKTKFTILDNRTIILQGGYSPDIVIKMNTTINRSATVTVLKDSFCSFDSAVLYIDGEVTDVSQVTKVR